MPEWDSNLHDLTTLCSRPRLTIVTPIITLIIILDRRMDWGTKAAFKSLAKLIETLKILTISLLNNIFGFFDMFHLLVLAGNIDPKEAQEIFDNLDGVRVYSFPK